MTTPLIAFSITLLTGLATCIGGLFVFFPNNKNVIFLSVSLALSGIIMIYISLFEILPNAVEQLQINHIFSPRPTTISAFIVGIICIAFIDTVLSYIQQKYQPQSNLQHMGLITFLILTIHNLPEGFITFISFLENPTLGIPIALTIALHNIPEGIAIAVPVYILSNSKTKAFGLTLCSGLAEPLGAVIGYFILKSYISSDILGIAFGIIAGIMCFIAIHDLIPTAHKLKQKNNSIHIKQS